VKQKLKLAPVRAKISRISLSTVIVAAIAVKLKPKLAPVRARISHISLSMVIVAVIVLVVVLSNAAVKTVIMSSR
jgi:hypothetical protein